MTLLVSYIEIYFTKFKAFKLFKVLNWIHSSLLRTTVN